MLILMNTIAHDIIRFMLEKNNCATKSEEEIKLAWTTPSWAAIYKTNKRSFSTGRFTIFFNCCQRLTRLNPDEYNTNKGSVFETFGTRKPGIRPGNYSN